ncbi:MAG TPA: DUF3540 domain-containing protein [Caldimonas sp.]
MGARPDELIRQIVDMPVNAIGRVAACDDAGNVTVFMASGRCTARRAASCLLAPEVGDSVLVCGPEVAALYVIAVLERPGDLPLRLTLGRDAEISSRGKLTVSSDELVVRAGRATTLIDHLSSFGREVTASVRRIKLVGNVFESFFERVNQFAGHSARVVDGVDQVRSTTIDYRAGQSLSLQGSEVIATAKTLVKIDGGQIHIG